MNISQKAGKVFEFADEKKCGLEDSARKLRYEKFSEFMENEDVDFLCLRAGNSRWMVLMR